jgi:hypothetical protein
MHPSLRALVAGVVVLLAGCASGGGRYGSLTEPGFSVREGQAWAWRPTDRAMPGPADPRVDNDIVRNAIERGIRAAMASRGLVEATDPGEADLLVAYRVGLRRRVEQREEIAPPRPIPRQRVVCGPRGCVPVLDLWGWHGPPVTTTRTIEYLEGGVMLDVFDARSGRLGWRGTLEDRVQKDGLPPQATIDTAMRKLVAGMPGTP